VTGRTTTLSRIGLAVAGGGGVAVVLGWLGIADAKLLPDQVAYFASGAVLGVAALGGGLALLMTASLGAEADRLDRVLETLASTTGDAGKQPENEVTSEVPEGASDA
jgi:hypothetical protein